ncbi:MAG: pyruvate dehydrogenase complex dihydrolipoamide acetyltransferase [Pseudomonadota bacterium]
MPVNILMPALSPTMEEGTLAKWLVKAGDEVRSGDVIAEIETDKATMEVEAVEDGTIGQLAVADGTEGVKINTVIAVLLEDGETEADLDAAIDAAPSPSATASAEMPPPVPPAPALSSATKEETARIFASPLARRIAKDRGLDLSSIKGTGPKGRIVKSDLEEVMPAVPQPSPAEIPDTTPSLTSDTALDKIKALYVDRKFEEVALDGMRKTIAARLTEAKQTIPHFYLRREVELDALLAFRADLNAQLSARGVKLSVNDFIIKACALALQDVPDCNAAWARDRLLRFSASDVSVAVAIDGGLITPVIRDAETKTISAISTEMKDLAARARDRKLSPSEYQGGAFSISNLGMMGIENFDAVINPPQGAILAVGAGKSKPVVRDDDITIATIMSLTLSVDHRVIDGALGAEFLAAIKHHIENPVALLA